jgi:hypothetical protein
MVVVEISNHTSNKEKKMQNSYKKSWNTWAKIKFPFYVIFAFTVIAPCIFILENIGFIVTMKE